ncbi:MAG TPA: hypothetical protein DHU55_10570 [Blastocatellia bacterium]|jgi:hypothetical protein|nr:hypothetical protein [Blastocatellia bacterium]HAF23750.1 hypothetical protein [Blastocatellia bacterium]HCX30196.1 hypothetical protein [Blastocatellia bacterium]
MNESLATHYLEDSIASLRAYKKLADKALDQLSEDEFFITLDEEANSIAVIMKHMAGNMFSRWTDFLTTDGEKPDRHRDMEFVIEPKTSREDVLAYWEKGWQRLFESLEPLGADDLMTKVLIRGEEHTVVQAVNRQLMHYSNHIGQIVFLAKHFRSAEWKSLSIPRNRSAEFNAYLAEKPGVADKEKQLETVVDFASQTKSQR